MSNVVLIVLDGFGIAPPGPGNPVYLANPSTINSLLYSYPNTTLKASGEAVGLPPQEVGNTEVGHINLGAGKIVYQDLPRINMSIADGSFYKNEALLSTVAHVQKNNGKLHLIGLVGEGYVHSSVDHLYALLYFAKENNLKNVFVHAITDGRDSPPKAAEQSIAALEEKTKQLQIGAVASVMGRYYAMDRDRRWERIEKAYICLTKGGGQISVSALEAVRESYKKGVTDEFILPTVITGGIQGSSRIEAGDAVIYFNYRIDRPRELTKAFVLEDFAHRANESLSFDPYQVKYEKSHLSRDRVTVTPPFVREEKIPNLLFVTMTEYEKGLPASVAFPPSIVEMPVGKILSDSGIKQLRLSESEKERFVTYYFNGLREQAFPGEDHLIIPSPKVPTYDMKPEMSAGELATTLIQKMKEKLHSFILINFANADMVGHTGNIEASVKAVKTLDICLGEIVKTALETGWTVLITADHGNVEQKINPQTGQISTEHTNNPVPFIAISNELQGRVAKLQNGILADVTPTILKLLGIPKPATMTGRNLLEEIE